MCGTWPAPATCCVVLSWPTTPTRHDCKGLLLQGPLWRRSDLFFFSFFLPLVRVLAAWLVMGTAELCVLCAYTTKLRTRFFLFGQQICCKRSRLSRGFYRSYSGLLLVVVFFQQKQTKQQQWETGRGRGRIGGQKSWTIFSNVHATWRGAFAMRWHEITIFSKEGLQLVQPTPYTVAAHNEGLGWSFGSATWPSDFIPNCLVTSSFESMQGGTRFKVDQWIERKKARNQQKQCRFRKSGSPVEPNGRLEHTAYTDSATRVSCHFPQIWTTLANWKA